jgi:acetyl-CoA acetyltransferase
MWQEQWNISREEQDAFALCSQQKYFAAKAAGKWKDEIVPIEIISKVQTSTVVDDEHPTGNFFGKIGFFKTCIYQRRNGDSWQCFWHQ